MAIAEKTKADLQKAIDGGKVNLRGTVETQIVRATDFYPAEEAHQRYLEKNPNGYCNHFYRFKEWPDLN